MSENSSSRSTSIVNSGKSASVDAEFFTDEPASKRHRRNSMEIGYSEEPNVPELSGEIIPKTFNHTFKNIVNYSAYSSSEEEEEEDNDEEDDEEMITESREEVDITEKKEDFNDDEASVEDPMDDGRLHNEEEDALLINDLDAYPSANGMHEQASNGNETEKNTVNNNNNNDNNDTSKEELDYDYQDGFKWIPDSENPDVDIPVLRTKPINLKIDEETGKAIFPDISKEKSLHCRSCLKMYSNEQFLDAYIGGDQPPAGFYYLLRLLGFRMTNHKLLLKIMLTIKNPEKMGLPKNLPSLEEIGEDNLQDLAFFDKSDCDNLLKDLTIALNNVLVGRIRLPNFNTLEQVIEKISIAKKVLVLTGAGISTSLGIPDFRSKNGLYEKVSSLNLDDAQDVFTLDVFLENPSIFYSIAHEILPPDGIFSPLHAFIKLLQDKGILLRNYTQNIDNIESFVGIEDDKVIQCHGSFATATCVTCNYCVKGTDIYKYIRTNTIPLCPYCLEEKELVYPTQSQNQFMKENDDNDEEEGKKEKEKNNDKKSVYLNDNPGEFFNLNEKLMDLRKSNSQRIFKHHVEHTAKSFGVLKPDITFFGEGLPKKYNDNIDKDCKECDLLLCIGTSLKVQPVSNIVNLIDPKIPQILINRDDVTTNEFDVKLLGLCDEVAALIAQRMKWDIPHVKWEQEFKKAEFDIIEGENGLYNISTKKI
ncbi:hypothetical protein ACO0SA_004949 [Hanseniaspora valbyensis]